MNRKKDYRDLKKHRDTCNKQNKRYYGKTSYKYERRRYTVEEDVLILSRSMTDSELSEKIHRSVKSIQIRRCRLNKGQCSEAVETLS